MSNSLKFNKYNSVNRVQKRSSKSAALPSWYLKCSNFEGRTREKEIKNEGEKRKGGERKKERKLFFKERDRMERDIGK